MVAVLNPLRFYTLHYGECGWLGQAMVLGSFQCRGVLLLWHMVGQGPAVLAVGAGWVGYVLFNYFLNLVHPFFLFFFHASSVGR